MTDQIDRAYSREQDEPIPIQLFREDVQSWQCLFQNAGGQLPVIGPDEAGYAEYVLTAYDQMCQRAEKAEARVKELEQQLARRMENHDCLRVTEE